MRISNLIKVALRSLSKNKMRTFLTMLGIIIGVASVIAMLAIGQGSKQTVEKSVSSLGTNAIMVYPVFQPLAALEAELAQHLPLLLMMLMPLNNVATKLIMLHLWCRKGCRLFTAHRTGIPLLWADTTNISTSAIALLNSEVNLPMPTCARQPKYAWWGRPS